MIKLCKKKIKLKLSCTKQIIIPLSQNIKISRKQRGIIHLRIILMYSCMTQF
jgi:hypothetical protein